MPGIGKGSARLVGDWNVPVGTRPTWRSMLPAHPTGSALSEAVAEGGHTTLAGRDGGFRLGLQLHNLSPAAPDALAGAI